MIIRSTYFQHKPRFSYTWRSPQNTYSQIDHVLIDGRHFSDIIDVKTLRGANVDSDHFLLMVKLRQKLSVANKSRSQPTPRLNTDRLKLADVAGDYAAALGEALPDDDAVTTMSPTAHWRIVERAISKAAERHVGYMTRSQRKEWFDDECRRALSEKNAARARMLQRETRQNVANYRRLRRQQTRLFQEKKRLLGESEEQQMKRLTQSGETRKFYRMLNAARSGDVRNITLCRDAEGSILADEREMIDRWKCHFDGHLNGAQARNLGLGVECRIEQHISLVAGDEVPTPSLEEVTSVIKQLKNNKSAGSEGLAAELFKMGPERLAVSMHQLIVKVWEQEELPEEWKLGIIHPVYKKGDRLDCGNYRAITVLNAAYKILSRILFCRLAPLASDFIGSYQAAAKSVVEPGSVDVTVDAMPNIHMRDLACEELTRIFDNISLAKKEVKALTAVQCKVYGKKADSALEEHNKHYTEIINVISQRNSTDS
ncbi:uncharacterized protein LOC128710733 [Anopheles marshallii]|uniref:uncharacterized protein LOC128710733 n=1 Tax=Anopheles marshallii TaxID=1521116 RepID=UPI00237C3DB4|nr:uncharacterized protein LOC128710733 [Anopheles marshallii]